MTALRPLVVLILAACATADRASADSATASVVPDSVALSRARAAADDLGRDLVGMLTAELQRGGPEGAIAICSDSAQLRTARHAAAGVMVKRVGTRVRNPLNEPDSTERLVLSAFAAAIAANRSMPDTAFVAPGAGGGMEVRYLRAIRLQPPCLACHGDPAMFSPGVRALLRERYPADQATGYTAGELRGAVSVRVATGR
jgi:hypothetical protein